MSWAMVVIENANDRPIILAKRHEDRDAPKRWGSVRSA